SECLSPKPNVAWTSETSELGHIDMEEFWARTQKVTRSPWMDKLIGSALHFAGGIPVSAVNNEFLMVIAQCYNKDT
ncbi:hypothetical protein KI387_008792, partial [Taxus chinensis]